MGLEINITLVDRHNQSNNLSYANLNSLECEAGLYNILFRNN